MKLQSHGTTELLRYRATEPQSYKATALTVAGSCWYWYLLWKGVQKLPG